MNIREAKAFTDMIASIFDAAEKATNKEHKLSLQGFAVQSETLKLEITRSHSDEIENLKSRHLQAIDKLNRKQVNAIATIKTEQAAAIERLNTEQADFVADLKSQNATLESQLAAYRQQPPAVFNKDTGTYFDKSTDYHYCPHCWHELPPKYVPMQDNRHGWQCGACDRKWDDPKRGKQWGGHVQ